MENTETNHPKFLSANPNPQGAVDVLAEEVRRRVSEVELVDVRTPEEFSAELGHIAGAGLHCLGPDLSEFLAHADKEKTYVFVCRSGGRSTGAALEAQSKGFTNVFNLAGGMIYWNALGFPVER